MRGTRNLRRRMLVKSWRTEKGELNYTLHIQVIKYDEIDSDVHYAMTQEQYDELKNSMAIAEGEAVVTETNGAKNAT